jgi:hypothetical protein
MFEYVYNNVIKNIIIMACGCKNKQNQTAPRNESVKKANTLGNGTRGVISRGLRTEKRIIR